MSNELVEMDFSADKLQLLKDTVCRGSTDDEFQMFVHVCKRCGLDPFSRQIFAVKRWDSNLKRESMSVQTGIDGYRLIADRTGKYAPGRESTYAYKPDGSLLSATSFVKKLTVDGIWHEISYTAFFDEYCQRTKEGKPMAMWAKMPHVMLAKVAEAATLRKAFPAELSGLYTAEEMPVVELEQKGTPVDKTPITKEQATILDAMIGDDKDFRDNIMKGLEKLGVTKIDELPGYLYDRVYKAAKSNLQKRIDEKKDVEETIEA